MNIICCGKFVIQNFLTTFTEMKFVILLLLVLVIMPTLECNESVELIGVKGNNEEKSGCVGLIAFVALVVFSAYLYFDLAEKKKLRALLETRSQIPQQNPLQQSKSNQVYLKEQQKSHQIRNHAEFPIYKIAVTGGPCGGKTSGLDRIKQELTDKGFRVFSVPEIPTLVVQAGGMILMSKFSTEEKIHFQSLLMRFQMYAEDYFTKLAEMSKSPSIILCDRGTVDPYAYISKEEFQAIMDEEGWSWVTLRDRRYDRVIFLNSAAVGAEDFYTLGNNAARSEGLQLARALNQKTLEAWTGHPNLSIIANIKGETFNDKMKHAVQAVEQTVGLERTNVSHEKLLIKEPKFPENVKVECTEIEEGFLINKDSSYDEDTIKKRGYNNNFTYRRKYRTKKNENGDYVQEIRKPLTSLQYVTLKEQLLDPEFNVVKRRRLFFAYNDIPYAIDIYDEVKGEKNVHLLRFNAQSKENAIPDFIEVVKNVKKDKTYNLREIARKH